MQEIYQLLSDEYRSKKPDIIGPIFPASDQAAAAEQYKNKSRQQ
jgi:hypothetical protein